MDLDKARALDLAVSFVGDEWKLLSEDDITVSILRYSLAILTKISLPKVRFL